MSWPVTRTILRADIRRALTDESATAAEQDFSDTSINSEIDRALRDVGLELHLPMGQAELNIALVAGQVYYTVNLAGSIMVEQLRLKPNATTGLTDATVDRLLIEVSQAEGQEIMGGGEFATETTLDAPRVWWPEPRLSASPTTEADARFGIWPAPSAAIVAAHALRVRHYPIFTAIAGDTGVMQLPEGCDTAIVSLAAHRLAYYRGDGQLSDKLLRDYQLAIARVNGLLGKDLYDSTRRPVDAFGDA